LWTHKCHLRSLDGSPPRGTGAEHVADKRMQAASDVAIWNYALGSGAVTVTKDEDFAQRTMLTGRDRWLSGSGCGTRDGANCSPVEVI
jgi:predicted nuclease of predicted toxin-antitoxin system